MFSARYEIFSRKFSNKKKLCILQSTFNCVPYTLVVFFIFIYDLQLTIFTERHYFCVVKHSNSELASIEKKDCLADGISKNLIVKKI